MKYPTIRNAHDTLLYSRLKNSAKGVRMKSYLSIIFFSFLFAIGNTQAGQEKDCLSTSKPFNLQQYLTKTMEAYNNVMEAGKNVSWFQTNYLYQAESILEDINVIRELSGETDEIAGLREELDGINQKINQLKQNFKRKTSSEKKVKIANYQLANLFDFASDLPISDRMRLLFLHRDSSFKASFNNFSDDRQKLIIERLNNIQENNDLGKYKMVSAAGAHMFELVFPPGTGIRIYYLKYNGDMIHMGLGNKDQQKKDIQHLKKYSTSFLTAEKIKSIRDKKEQEKRKNPGYR